VCCRARRSSAGPARWCPLPGQAGDSYSLRAAWLLHLQLGNLQKYQGQSCCRKKKQEKTKTPHKNQVRRSWELGGAEAEQCWISRIPAVRWCNMGREARSDMRCNTGKLLTISVQGCRVYTLAILSLPFKTCVPKAGIFVIIWPCKTPHSHSTPPMLFSPVGIPGERCKLNLPQILARRWAESAWLARAPACKWEFSPARGWKPHEFLQAILYALLTPN